MKEPLKSKSPLAKRMTIMIIILVIVFGGLFAFNVIRHILMQRFFANFKLPPVTISTTKATVKNWQPYISVVGTLVAVNGVNVTTQVSGQVISINFESGQFVRAGQPIVKLDDRTDQQDLANYQAQLTLAKMNYQRQIDLLKTRSTSQQSVDQAYAQLQQYQAQVDKTLVLIDQKNIKAPFDGKIGIRTVNIGQYVSPGTALVSLQSLNPMYTQFSLPEQYFNSLYVGQPTEMTVITYGNRVFKGKINAVDATFSNQTRNLLIQTVVPNNDYKLYPGMSANVHVLLPLQQKVVTVPQTAVDFSLFGDSVFVVQQEGKDQDGPILIVHRRYVTTGDRQGNEVAIIKGIKANEEVVTSGQLKLDDGTRVRINNSVNIQNLGQPEDYT